MTDAIKKETDFIISHGFCVQCGKNRFFYQHKTGGEWFCQFCDYVKK